MREFLTSLRLLVLAALVILSFAPGGVACEDAVRVRYGVVSLAGFSARAQQALNQLATGAAAPVEALSADRDLMVVALQKLVAIGATNGKVPVGVLRRRHLALCEGLRMVRRQRINEKRAHGVQHLAQPLFRCAQDTEVKALATPNDPRYPELWGMRSAALGGIDAPAAWDKSTGSRGVVVAIIDTGVDYTHPDLAANMWSNPREIPGNGIDDDGNGYVDDVYGMNGINNSGNPMDDNNHGTHVAGTIGGVGNNGVGVAGVNWSVSIMALKFLSANGGGWGSDAVKCMNYMIRMASENRVPIVAVNNSWGGGPYDPTMFDAITRASSSGILFVAAAGNSNNNNDQNTSFPSGYRVNNVIAVAAANDLDNRASFSSYGATTVHLAAPGTDIVSTLKGGLYNDPINTPGSSRLPYSGTSMATPHVTGALALAKAYGNSYTMLELKDLLLNNVRPLPQWVGLVSTGGFLNVNNMLNAINNAGRRSPAPNLPTPAPTSTPTMTPTLTPTPLPTATATPTATPTPVIGAMNISVTTTDGAVVGGARVSVSMDGGSAVQLLTDVNGQAVVGNLRGWNYSVSARASGVTFSAPATGRFLANSQVAVVGTKSPFVLTALVLDRNKDPLRGVTVTLGTTATTTTDAQGRAAFAVAYGQRYSLKVSGTNLVFDVAERSGDVYGNLTRVFVGLKK